MEHALDVQSEEQLQVLLIDDDPLARRMIRDALGLTEMVIVHEAQATRDAVRAARYYKPDVILLTVVGSGLADLGLLKQIMADDKVAAKVVVLATCEEVDLGCLALRMGAVGYLHKGLDLAVLPRVLRDVADGGAAVSRTFTADLVRRLRDVPEGGVGMRPVSSVLTTREWEIIDELSVDRSTEQIADALVVSPETVRTHIKHIQRKLDAHSRAEIVEIARRLRMGAGEAPRADAYPL